MLVDHERVLLELKRVLLSKKSHGADALLATVAQLEVEHQLKEGVPEKALRLYGFEIPGDLPRPADRAPLAGGDDGHSTVSVLNGSGPRKENRSAEDGFVAHGD